MEFTCHYCLEVFPWAEHTWDHVVPRSRGGRDAQWNLVDCCGPCNVEKSNDVPEQHCDYCIEAINRHPTMFLSERRGLMYRVAEEWDDEVGDRCLDCGLITWDPNDCGWCAAELRIVSQR